MVNAVTLSVTNRDGRYFARGVVRYKGKHDHLVAVGIKAEGESHNSAVLDAVKQIERWLKPDAE